MVCVGCSNSEPIATDGQRNHNLGDDHESEQQPSPEAARKLETITTALKSLLKRTNDDAFVICSHANSHEYVQFAVDEQGLFLDLPTIPLDGEQKTRAIRFFNKIGVRLQDSEFRDASGEQVVGKMETFLVEIGHDADRGAELALDIFAEVYDRPIDFPLVIEEN